MKLHDLEKVNTQEYKDFLINELNLSPYQKDKLNNNKILENSKYIIMKKYDKVEDSNILWRLTVIFLPIYYITVFITCIFNYFIFGKFACNWKFLYKVDKKWFKKL